MPTVVGPAEPSYPKPDAASTVRRSWELRNFISQSKGESDPRSVSVHNMCNNMY